MITVVLGAVAAVVGISLLIVVHEAGHYLVARLCGMKVERFSIGFGPVVLKARWRGTEWAVSALPLGGYVKITGMAPGEDVDPADPTLYSNQPSWRRFLVILAGPAMNYALGVIMAAALLLGPGLRTPDPAAGVGRVLPGLPAEQAGLAPGDRVLSVADRPVATWEDMVRELQAHPAQQIPVVVERGQGADATRLTLQLTPRDEGGVGKAGFEPHMLAVTSPGVGAAVAEGFRRTNELAWGQVAVFGKIFSGGAKGTSLSGPVKILESLLRAFREGSGEFVNLLWLISVVLAIFNLFPFPALDGGRLVFLVYELVTRRRVNARVENVVNAVGFVALIVLMLGVTIFGDLGLGKYLHLRGR